MNCYALWSPAPLRNMSLKYRRRTGRLLNQMVVIHGWRNKEDIEVFWFPIVQCYSLSAFALSSIFPVLLSMSALKATFMDPVTPNDSLVTHLHSPPRMEAYEDNILFREYVMEWVIYVKSCADGGDGKSKGTLECLALTFYLCYLWTQAKSLNYLYGGVRSSWTRPKTRNINHKLKWLRRS